MRRLFFPAVVFVAAALLVFAGLTVIGAIGSNQDATETAQVDANVARALTEQAIQSRVESVISACRETNARHRAVTRVLRNLDGESSPAERRLFVKAIAPKRDCQARARKLVPEAF